MVSPEVKGKRICSFAGELVQSDFQLFVERVSHDMSDRSPVERTGQFTDIEKSAEVPKHTTAVRVLAAEEFASRTEINKIYLNKPLTRISDGFYLSFLTTDTRN